MKKHIYNEDNYKQSKWSGGNTYELAIYPEKADYLDRDFLWRLSSADSDREESSFTKLPDYDRILMVLDGSVVLAHGEERTASLGAWESDAFDGAIKTKCFGQLKKDYNLIHRKGTKGRMELIELTSEGQHVVCSPDGSRSVGLYSAEGYTVVSADGKTDMLKEGQQMVLELEPGEDVNLTVMGEGKCIFTEVIFNKDEMLCFGVEDAAAHGMEGSDADGVTGGAGGQSDFMLALKLSLGNNRWSSTMRKMKKKGLLYSPALNQKLQKLDKFFVTGIIWAVGVILCLLLLPLGAGPGIVFCSIIAFSVVDVFLISPLIYMLYLPRPLRAHIKKSDDLNAYERQLFEEQLDYDPRRDKLMHKYRDRSGEQYSGAADFWKKMSKDD